MYVPSKRSLTRSGTSSQWPYLSWARPSVERFLDFLNLFLSVEMFFFFIFYWLSVGNWMWDFFSEYKPLPRHLICTLFHHQNTIREQSLTIEIVKIYYIHLHPFPKSNTALLRIYWFSAKIFPPKRMFARCARIYQDQGDFGNGCKWI